MTELLLVQEVVYTNLNENEDLIALANVYDEVSEGSKLPYIGIGEAECKTGNMLMQGNTATVTHIVDVFSDKKGTLEVLTIVEKVREILKEYNNPDYKGYTIWFDKVEKCKVEKIMIETGIIRHAELKMNFIISKN